MPAPIDVVFVFVLVVVASVFEHLYFWPSFRREIADGRADARVRGYRRVIVGQWAFAATALAIWISYGRSAGALRMTAPSGWRLALSITLVAVMVTLVFLQLRAVHRLSAARREAVRPRLGKVAFLVPHTRNEFRWFIALSATAGVCEELLFRGYLTWFLAPWLGTAGAFAAVVALFGIGHAYQGVKGATRATLAGAALTAIVAATGWLVPAMIVHALADAGSGTMGFWIFREERPVILERSEAA
jgi:membrane protease YdiL (CAAX protease family)